MYMHPYTSICKYSRQECNTFDFMRALSEVNWHLVHGRIKKLLCNGMNELRNKLHMYPYEGERNTPRRICHIKAVFTRRSFCLFSYSAVMIISFLSPRSSPSFLPLHYFRHIYCFVFFPLIYCLCTHAGSCLLFSDCTSDTCIIFVYFTFNYHYLI